MAEPAPLDIPVVLVAFNRPDHVARTLAALRAVRPRRLFLVCDGPRADRPEDATRCAAVRTVLDSVDWPADLARRWSDTNLGCEATVELGLDWVFGRVDRAIVLEDDCVADPTFFRYAAELLDRYAADRRVWHVAGNSHGVPAALFGADSYRFAGWASVWGWATWADRWQRHRTLFPRDHRAHDGLSGHEPLRTAPAVPRPGSLVTRGGSWHFRDAAASDDVVTHGWDKHWWLSMLAEGGLAATPAVNLVENIGFGPEATHGVHARPAAPALPTTFPLRHPDDVVLDVEVARELELALNRVGGRSARLARSVIRSPRLRAVARRAVHSAVAADLSRTASRLTHRSPSARSRPGREHP